MAKAVILKTDDGVMIFGNIQCSIGAWFDAEGCFKYCQEDTEQRSYLQSCKLKGCASELGREKTTEDWYKYRENFIDIAIPYDCNQNYQN